MKKNRLLAALASLTAGLLMFTFSFNQFDLSRKYHNPKEIKVGIKKIAHQKNRAEITGNILEAREKEESLDKKDSPEKFAQWQHDIRTRNGEINPSYPPNYKIREYLKARNVSSIKELKRNSTKAAYTWVERGPGNISGRTRGLIIHPDDPTGDTWIVGSVGGGVWKTTDAGTTWRTLTSQIPNLATSTIAMAGSDHSVIYAGTGEGFYNVDQIDGTGIWKTTDGGATWNQLQSTTDPSLFKNIMRIVVDPTNPDVVLAASGLGFNGGATSSKIYKSTDGGNSWTEVYNSSTSNVQQIVADPLNFNHLYATINGVGVISSKNAGDTWNNSSSGIGSVGRMEMSISPADPNRLFISAQGGPSGSIFYYSTDAGSSWTGVDLGKDFLGGQGWYDNACGAHPYDPNICYVGGVNIWKVTINSNGAASISIVTDGYGQFGGTGKGVHVDQHNFAFVKTDTANKKFRMLVGNDGGVAYTDNEGATFKAPKNGYNTTQFYGADKRNGADEYVGGMQDNSSWFTPAGVSADSLTQWKAAWGGDGYEASWHYTDPNKIIVSSQYNRLGRSLDGGKTFQNIVSSVTDVGGSKAPFFTKVAKSKQDPDLIFIMGSSGAWRSADFGENWRNIKLAGGDFGGTSTFSQIKISLADPQVVWVGSNVNPTGGMFVSVNGGYNFTKTNGYQTIDMGRITGLDTHPVDPNTAYVTFSFADAPKILRTTNLGQTWEDISGFGTNAESSTGFPDVATFSVLVMPFDSNMIWSGTEIGIFETVNGGAEWHFLDSNLPAVAVYELSIVNDQVIAATHGRGVWTATLAELNGYEPPDVRLAPILRGVTSSTSGLEVSLDLREIYDSTHVLANGNTILTIFNSAPADTTVSINFSPDSSGTVEFSAISFDNGRELFTESFFIELFTLNNPQPSFATEFTKEDEQYFIGEDFVIKRFFGFKNPAIHSKHDYDNEKTITYTFTIPITVSDTSAFIEYDDIAIIEPGEPGSKFGSSNFYDYVVVEGSKDGFTWTPLADGYDSRWDPDWLNIYNNGGKIADAFKHHTINILSTFNAGDVILIRFRLYADQLENGWGWAIDNLQIQERLTSVNESEVLPADFKLEQNYPNPFNPSTIINFSVPEASTVSLKIYDVLGREAATLVNKEMNAGRYHFTWNASQFASGVYYYTLKAGNKTATKKLMLLK